MEQQYLQRNNTVTSEKKMKKKPTKIIVGKGIDHGNTKTYKIESKKPANGERKLPTREIPTEAVSCFSNNNQNYRIEKKSNNYYDERIKSTQANTNQNKTNGSYSYYQRNGNSSVVRNIHVVAGADDICEALNNSYELPGKLRNALGTATLELNNRREFVVHKKEYSDRVNYYHLKRILQKHAFPGFSEWLRGRRGWTIATPKTPYIKYHRNLHEAHTAVMKSFLEKVDDDLKRRLVVLKYKLDPETQENGGRPLKGKRQSTQTLWKKVSEAESLQDAVGNIRPFLEVVRYFCTDPKEKWTTLPWLMPIITQEECMKRLNRISELVFTLMRSSDWGPDVPVHWAAHPPLNSYPRSVITSTTMNELVIGVTNILSNLFLRYPITVDSLNGVDKILPKFHSRSGDSSDGNGVTKSKSSRTKGRHADSADHLVIDLTKLHISDD